MLDCPSPSLALEPRMRIYSLLCYGAKFTVIYVTVAEGNQRRHCVQCSHEKLRPYSQTRRAKFTASRTDKSSVAIE